MQEINFISVEKNDLMRFPIANTLYIAVKTGLKWKEELSGTGVLTKYWGVYLFMIFQRINLVRQN